MTRGTALGAAVVWLALWPAVADAQSCQPELERAGLANRRELGPGRTHDFLSGGVVIRCVGRADTLRSDSAASYSDLERMDFVGNVRFRDDTVTLTARQVRYFWRDERLEAYGDVRLLNRLTGSVLTGPNLTYWRSVPSVRDTSEMLATQRPQVVYRSSADSVLSPYVIIGERVRLRGESSAHAAGRVTITRDDFAAESDSAALDFHAGEGVLLGHAAAESRDSAGYRIEGRTIAYRLVDDRLNWVRAREAARARSNDWQVVGDTIEFDVARDRVQGGRVWGDSTRARAISELHTVDGDSLAIDAPEQQLREVRAFGNARATARRDIGAAEIDWVEGDTVTSRFAPKPDGEGRELRLLEAVGAARAFYHVFDPAAPDAVPGIAYSRGRHIAVRFLNDELERVDVVDGADGVYLEPKRTRP